VKPNLVDQICELLKQLCNYRMLPTVQPAKKHDTLALLHS